MKRTYDETVYKEKHYRAAVKDLQTKKELEVINKPEKEDGTQNGVGHDDIIKFESKTEINDFL